MSSPNPSTDYSSQSNRLSGLYQLTENESSYEGVGTPTSPQFQPLPNPDPISPPDPVPEPFPRPRPYPNTDSFLRLDVDGDYPLMTVSGATHHTWLGSGYWLAHVKEYTDYWFGYIRYRHGSNLLTPDSDQIKITVQNPRRPDQRTLTVRFQDRDGPVEVENYEFVSPYFRKLRKEVDYVEGTDDVFTDVDPCAHPNHPSSLDCGTLDMEAVFEKAGFEVNSTGGGGAIPDDGAGSDEAWSNAEIHDAMESYWSSFTDRPQWAFWTFFAPEHKSGSGLGGIMFDHVSTSDRGDAQRQGGAIFTDSFITDPPSGDPDPNNWIERSVFQTTVHEMGHALNLAHSWQKDLRNNWPFSYDEPEARSFMNYPRKVKGGQEEFFSDFKYRFSDQELEFLRHAPEPFVQPGHADWFENHGFRNVQTRRNSALSLRLTASREDRVYEFMEPVSIEVELQNISDEPVVLDQHVLGRSGNYLAVTQRQGGAAELWDPVGKPLLEPRQIALESEYSLHHEFFVSVGRDGWKIAEPGRYVVQLALFTGDQWVVSDRCEFQVLPPQNQEQRRVAQDYFRDEVGRVMAVGGSRALTQANDTLRRVAESFDDTRAAVHANLALGRPLAYSFNELVFPDQPQPMTAASDAGARIKTHDPDVDAAHTHLREALIEEREAAAESLGMAGYKRQVDAAVDQMSKVGRSDIALDWQETLQEVFEAKNASDQALEQIEKKKQSLRDESS